MIIQASAPRARPSSAAPPGSAVSTIWLKTPSITRHPKGHRKELRRVWNAADGKAAEAELGHLVAAYRDSAPKLADWLETAIPEGLAVFALPERHQKRMRTSNPMERSIQQEIKRRTVKVRVFPNEASLERLVTAILVEIDEKWETTEKPYITWKAEDD